MKIKIRSFQTLLIFSALLLLTFQTFCFTSCSNLFGENNSLPENSGASTESQLVIITGKVLLEGAIPSKLFHNSEGMDRTAFPQLPSLESLSFYIKATNKNNENDFYESNVDTGSNTYILTIPAPTQAEVVKNYNIIITARNGTTDVLTGTSEDIDLSLENTVFTKDITLHAISTSGSGSINLSIIVDKEAGNPIANEAHLVIGSNDYVASYIDDGFQFNLPNETYPDAVFNAGVYPARFSFKKGTEEVYSFTQYVNIFSGLTTDTWVKNGAEPYLDDSGSSTICKITPALIRDYELTNIYIDSSKQTTNSSAANYTSASGTFLNPLTTFKAAVDKIQNSTRDYTIHVKGSFQGCFELPDSLDSKMNSLTIVGESPLVNGEPQDRLYGYRGELGDLYDAYDFVGLTTTVNGETIVVRPPSDLYTNLYNEKKVLGVLTIKTQKNVTLKNIEISNGVRATGGGLFINGGSVTINDGVIIKNNLSWKAGGGIAVSGSGTLVITGGKITNNCCYHSEGNSMGGGISVRGKSKFILSGGEISYNKTSGSGGGVCYAGDGTADSIFIMTGGEICHNRTECVNSSGTVCGRGGGLDFSSGNFTMSDGSIHNNFAKSNYGGLFVNDGNLSITGGEIRDNTSEGQYKGIYIWARNTTLKLGGKAYIPAGEHGDHSICLEHSYSDGTNYDAKITLIGALTRHSKDDPIVITPGQYSRGLHLVEADDEYITDVTNYKNYFKVSDTDWDMFVSSDKKAITINSPIYIASPTANPTVCTNKGNDTTGNGTKTAPYASFTRACTDMTDDTVEYIILVDGTITGANTITGTAKSVSISGANGIDNYKEEGYVPADCLAGNSVNRALTIEIEKEVFISNLKIQSGNDTSGVGGGGIFIPSGATVTINEGVLITGNTTSTNGGGIYNNGTLYIKGGVITGNTAASGGGLYNAGTSTAPATATLENSAVIGTKFSASGTEPSHAVATESEKSNYASLNGGGVYNSDFASFTMNASLTESGGGIYYNYSKNSDGSLVMGTGGIQNYGTLTLNGGVIAYNGGRKAGAICHCSRNLTVDGVTIAYNAAEEVGKSCGGIYISGVDDTGLSCVVEYKNGIFKNNVDGNSDSSKGIGIYIESATYNPTVKITGGTFAANTVIYLEDNCYIQSGSSYYSSNIIFELQNYTEARTLVSSIDNTTVSSFWKSAKIMNDKMEVFESYKYSSSTVRTSAVALYKLDKVTADDVSISGYNSSNLSMEDGDQWSRNLKTRFDGNFYFKTSSGKYGVMRFTDITGYRDRMPIKYSMFDWEDRTAQSSCIWPSGKDFDKDSDGSGGDGKIDFYIYEYSTGNVINDANYFATKNGAGYRQMH